MAFTVETFKSKFTDFARSYQFMVSFTGAPVEGIRNPDMGFLVETTTLPTKNITAVDAAYMGQQVKLAGNVEYPDWEVTFRVDSEYKVYDAIREWLDVIRPNVGVTAGTLTTPGRGGYKGIIDFEQLDGNQKTIAGLKLFGAFPVALGGITLDTKTSDIQTFPVTFAYDYHTWKLGKIDAISTQPSDTT